MSADLTYTGQSRTVNEFLFERETPEGYAYTLYEPLPFDFSVDLESVEIDGETTTLDLSESFDAMSYDQEMFLESEQIGFQFISSPEGAPGFERSGETISVRSQSPLTGLEVALDDGRVLDLEDFEKQESEGALYVWNGDLEPGEYNASFESVQTEEGSVDVGDVELSVTVTDGVPEKYKAEQIQLGEGESSRPFGYSDKLAGTAEIEVIGADGDLNGDTAEVQITPGRAENFTDLQVEKEFVGIVAGSEGIQISFNAEDRFGNKIDPEEFFGEPYAEIGGKLVSLQGGDEVEESDKVKRLIPSNEIREAGIETGSKTVELVTVNVEVGDAEKFGEADVRLVHEVYGLDEGFNLRSVPQPATVVTEDVSSVKTWNPETESYETPESGASDKAEISGRNLHRGMFFEAKTSEARIGYDFKTNPDHSPVSVEMVDGWHLASSNFDISSEGEETFDVERTLQNDLANVDVGEEGLEFANDEGKLVSPERSVGPFEAYWVHVNDVSDQSSSRAVVEPGYDPNGRDTVADGPSGGGDCVDTPRGLCVPLPEAGDGDETINLPEQRDSVQEDPAQGSFETLDGVEVVQSDGS